MKTENGLHPKGLATLATLATTNLQAIGQPTTEQLPGNTLAAMRKSQPEGWGWWGYLLADGGRGSIRGQYPDRESALIALQAELPEQKVIKIVPFPGAVPEPDMPGSSLERVEIGRCEQPVIECQQCRCWTADRQNISGGMGTCGRGFKAMAYPWHKCRGEK